MTSYQFVKSDALDASKETPGLYVRNDSDIANVLQDIVLPKKILKKLLMRTEIFLWFITEIEKGKSRSFFVSNVSVYENPTKEQTLPLTLGGNTDLNRIVDAKLQQFFEYVN